MRHSISLQALFSYASRAKLAFFGTSAMFIVSNILLASFPWIIGQLTGALASRDESVVWWTAAIIIASISHDILWHGAEVVWLKTVVPRSYRFDDAIFNAILRHPYSYFVDRYTGKISSYAASLGRDFRELIDEYFTQYLNIPVALPILAATMFTVNVITGVVFLVSISLMFIVGSHLTRLAAQAERAEADEQSSIDGQTVDAISNFVTIKAFGSELREAKRLFQLRRQLIKTAEYSFFRSIILWATMSFFVRWVIWSATFILNVHLYLQGEINLAQMTTFLAAIVIFASTIWEVIWNISQLNIKLARMEESYRYLFGERNIFHETPDSGDTVLRPFRRQLQLHHLTFAYPDKPDTPVLRDISLTIARGEKIGVVGPSGGGKSTLIKLLLGYYPIQDSQLLLDGQPTDNRSLTDLTAYVPQDTSIFHRSIRDNIAYARPDATETDIIAAAKHAQAHDFISSLEHGYDTKVGERGVKLSGGQRQRIAIARAILKDAPLLLLDEATSALDSESEKQIQRALRELLINRTALVIAHRLSTIQHLDRIIVIDDGRIVEQGTHDQLLTNEGLYAKLWSHQTDGFLLQ